MGLGWGRGQNYGSRVGIRTKVWKQGKEGDKIMGLGWGRRQNYGNRVGKGTKLWI